MVPTKIEDTKEQHMQQMIIDSAVELFDQYGYNNVKISQITHKIGMTTGTFYYYFQSKDEVLRRIYDYYITLAVDMIKKIYDTKDISVKEKVYMLIKTHTQLISDYHAHVSVFFREYRNLSKEGLEEIKQKNSLFLSSFTKLIEQGGAEGVFRKDLNPKIISLAIIGMCNWMYQWYDKKGEVDVDQIGDIFFQMVSSGLYASEENIETNGIFNNGGN